MWDSNADDEKPWEFFCKGWIYFFAWMTVLKMTRCHDTGGQWRLCRVGAMWNKYDNSYRLKPGFHPNATHATQSIA